MISKRFFSLGCLGIFSTSLAADLVVHEWGTFTQVFGSDGTVLNGLEREEERLPPFVYGHAGLENGGLTNPQGGGLSHLLWRKGMRRPVMGVNAKMETPVIYFYADEPMQAQVEVEWKGGTISQWYPQRSGGEIPPSIGEVPSLNALSVDAAINQETSRFTKDGGINFFEGYEGSIKWDVSVSEKGRYDQADLFKGSETVSWLHPRIPDTSLLTTSEGESESYLFYRGLGRLDSKVSFSVDESETLKMTNNFREPIPFVMVFKNGSQGVSSLSISQGIAPGEILQVLVDEMVTSTQDWQKKAYQEMRAGLIDSGLYSAEAEAMIQTWWRSYFATPCFGSCPRVFWVMPNAQVEEVLPLNVSPQPDELTRVLVGRAEILTPSAEESLLVAAKEKAQYLPGDGRFQMAYQERIRQLRPVEENAKNTEDL